MNQQLKIPPSHNKLCREGALERLSRHGIEGKRVYLIDLIPLIEMIWAGGRVKAEKIDFLYNFIKRHINHINRLAGYVVLSMADAIVLAYCDPGMCGGSLKAVADMLVGEGPERASAQAR